MKPYPRYKPTGLAWLPSVPEHWEVVPFKSLFSLGKGLPITKADLVESGTPVVSYGQIHAKTNRGTHLQDELLRFVPDSLAAQKPTSRVGKGDFIFADTSEDLEGCGNFAFMDRDDTVYAGYHSIIAFAKKPEHGRYLSYLFQSPQWRRQIRQFANGVKVYSVTGRILNAAMVTLPDSSEQDRIVRYLDEKTAAIDELVRAKEREIDLLRERKQALVSEAVIGRDISTKCPLGRDASTMRPGCGRAVGASLPVFRLKELVRFFKGLNITKADLIPEGANVISYGQIHAKENDGRSLKDSFLRHTSFELTNDAARLSFGDIVFADTSEDQAGIGNCVLNDRHDPVWAGYHTVTARPSNPEIAPYLVILFQSNWWRDQLRRSSDGVKVYSVTQHSLGNTKVVLPPLPEQHRIVERLDATCSDLNAAESSIRKQISLLQELRTRLVSDAVTGAVEV